MTEHRTTNVIQSQADKFKEAARKHEADESEVAWEARLKKLAKAKPVPKTSHEQTTRPKG